MFISTGVSLLGAQPSGGGGLPNVYTTGLQLWWDFGEPTSYGGTGTTVTDISGNSNDGIMSGIQFTGSFGGGAYMGTDSDQVANTTNFLNSTKNWTICVFGDYNGTNFDRIWAGIMNGDSGDLAIGSSPLTQAKMIGSGGSQGFWNDLPSNSFAANTVNMLTYQCDNRNPFLRKFWRNQTNYPVTNAQASATTQIEANEGFTWGGYDQAPGTNAVKGTSYVALVYNTNLTQTQVDQNYNAYKTRFSLP